MSATRDDADRLALAAVLARIDDGAAPADALAAEPDPATRARLAPLVAAALDLRTAPLSPVRLAFRTRLHSTLVDLEARPHASKRRPLALRWPVARTAMSRPRMTVAWSIALALVVVGVAYAVGRAGPGGATDAGATPDRSGASAYSVAATAPPGRLATARARLRASPTASPPALGGSDALASRRTRIAASTGAAGASAGVARIVATPVDAARAGLVSATPPPAATATPPPPDAGAPRRAPTSRSSPPQPSPATATETPQPAPPGVTIGGAVTADGAAIVGATVQVWRAASAAACAPGDLTRTATAATDGQGRFTVIDLPPGIYLVSAEGGPTCLPRRWCAGAVEPAVDAPCAAARLALERAGDATGLANVAVEGLVEGCPNEEGPGG